MSERKKRLGKGLSSMIAKPVAVAPREAASDPDSTGSSAATDGISSLPVGEIVPNPHQPRQDFDEESLRSLTDSIRTSGVMQPIVVRSTASGFELVVGERRWRAAQAAGMERIPAVVHDLDDQTSAQWALVENLQREDLNPIERAEAFLGLQDQFGLTHQEIADQVGLTRSAVTNQIRLNELDEGTSALVRSGSLSAGHGRALLAETNIDRRFKLAREAMRENWSVRTLEAKTSVKSSAASSTAKVDGRHQQHADLGRQLGEHLGTRVHVREGRKKGSGQLVIEFYDLDQFDGLMHRLGFTPEA